MYVPESVSSQDVISVEANERKLIWAHLESSVNLSGGEPNVPAVLFLTRPLLPHVENVLKQFILVNWGSHDEIAWRTVNESMKKNLMETFTEER